MIIFVDIDGVLTHGAMYKPPKDEENCTIEDRWPFDENCVKVLNEFTEKHNAKIVISSAWRIGRTLEFLQELFKKRGIKAEVIGMTPKSEHAMYSNRGNNICKWIENNDCKADEQFVVIDDETVQIRHIEKYFKLGQMRIISVFEGWYEGGLKKEHLNEEDT